MKPYLAAILIMGTPSGYQSTIIKKFCFYELNSKKEYLADNLALDATIVQNTEIDNAIFF